MISPRCSHAIMRASPYWTIYLRIIWLVVGAKQTLSSYAQTCDLRVWVYSSLLETSAPYELTDAPMPKTSFFQAGGDPPYSASLPVGAYFSGNRYSQTGIIAQLSFLKTAKPLTFRPAKSIR